MAVAYFDRFEISMPGSAARDCSHSGECDSDVEHWAQRINRPATCTPDALRRELRKYGAWDDDQLANDDDNWLRIVWIAAGNIKEERAERIS